MYYDCDKITAIAVAMKNIIADNEIVNTPEIAMGEKLRKPNPLYLNLRGLGLMEARRVEAARAIEENRAAVVAMCQELASTRQGITPEILELYQELQAVINAVEADQWAQQWARGIVKDCAELAEMIAVRFPLELAAKTPVLEASTDNVSNPATEPVEARGKAQKRKESARLELVQIQAWKEYAAAEYDGVIVNGNQLAASCTLEELASFLANALTAHGYCNGDKIPWRMVAGVFYYTAFSGELAPADSVALRRAWHRVNHLTRTK